MQNFASDLPSEYWETRYREGLVQWERGELNPGFLAWRRSGVLEPCRILIPGAGRSPEPGSLLADGFDVEVLDLADTAVTVQTERLGPERVHQADVTRWAPERTFDAIYDQTCLCALPPPLRQSYVAQLRRWLRPGGSLFILFMQTGREGGPPFDCPIEAMRRLFVEWRWPETLPAPIAHGSGASEQPAILGR